MEIENISNDSLSTSQEKVKEVIRIEFDDAYKGDDLTRRVADILGMKSISGWSIIDTYENLALVHYDDDADMKECGHLRGVLIDTEKGDIIADSFGFTPTAVVDEIVEEDGKLCFVDNEQNKHVFNADANITRIFEGVVIRVIWFNNKLYRITHKKIFPVKSRWGNSKYFINLYEEAGGPVAEQLFDTTKPFSDTCYHFMVVDPSLLVATRQRVSAPYIVCLEKQTIKLSRDVGEIAPGKSTFETVDKIGGLVNKSMIHMPKKLTISEANKHLKSGYYKSFPVGDERLTTGEGVIIYHKENDVITKVLKVNSKSYDYRCTMRGGNPNIVNQFYTLLSCTYPDITGNDAWEALQKKFVIFPLYDVEVIKGQFDKSKVILTLGTGELDKRNYESKEARIHLLWINYVVTLPANFQEDALEILDNFHEDKKNLCEWLATLEINVKNIDESQHGAHVKRIINAARTLSRQKIKSGQNKSAKGADIPYPTMVKKTIRNLVYKEKGGSLYQMIREMKRPPKAKKDEVKVEAFEEKKEEVVEVTEEKK